MPFLVGGIGPQIVANLVNIGLNLYTQGVAPGLDFSDLNFIDSMGLGVLVRAQSRLRGEAPARQVVIRHPNAHARKVFEITGLDRVLDIQP